MAAPNRWNRGRWIATVLGLAVMFLTGFLTHGVVRQEEWPNGNDVARKLIQASRAGLNPVQVALLAPTVCVVGEQRYAPAAAKRLIPGHKVVFEESDESEGFWFLLLLSDKKELVILAVDQRLLFWDTSTAQFNGRGEGCISGMRISVDAKPRIEGFIGKQ